MTKIIAEFCQNHLGNREILKNMILAAKSSGATYAKIQGLYSWELTKRIEFENPSSQIYRPFKKEFDRLKLLDLSFETEVWFVEECKRNSIIPMITVFSHNGIGRALDAGFKHIKIASYDCASIPLIKQILKFASEVVISTGATYWSEIEATANFLRENKADDQEITFLHATTIYPTNLEEVALLKMLLLKTFGFNIGYSDHTSLKDSSLIASKAAILLGAQYIERHFTILDASDTKDGPISIGPLDLVELIEFSKHSKSVQLQQLDLSRYSQMFHLSSIEPSDQELSNRSYYRGRVASAINGKDYFAWQEIQN